MLSLGGERLLPPPEKKRSFGSLPALRSGYATTIMVFFFAHLIVLEYPDHHPNLKFNQFFIVLPQYLPTP